MTLVAERVREIAKRHGVVVDHNSQANFLARHVSRIEGIEGDETLEMIAELATRGHLTKAEAYKLGLDHSLERHAITQDAESEDDDRQVAYVMGSVR